MSNDVIILLARILVALNGAFLGCYLLLQKNALVSDAISHAVLPGIVLAFMISGTKASFTLMIGAACTGILLSQTVLWLQEKANMQKDAAIGLTYTFLFAVGLLMMSLFLKDVDLDADCVLFGEIAYVPIDLHFFSNGWNIPRAFIHLSPSLIICVLVLFIARRAFFLSTFNTEYSSSIGFNVKRWQSILLSLTSLYTVMSFELVGAIMVVGFMIIPPATALLFSKNLKQMLILSSAFGLLAVFLGYFFAKSLNLSITGSMVGISGVVLFICVLLRNKRWKLSYGRK